MRSGWYRASVLREDGTAIVFNAEVQQKNGKPVMFIRNAAERLLVDDVKVKGDSVHIEMPFFESYFRLQFQNDGSLKGKWFKAGSLKLLEFPVTFVYGQKERFAVNENTTQNVTGRWQVTFTRVNGAERPAIAEFKQNGTALSGTFLTPSGDYRFLEGIVNGKEMQLSCFDGSHAYYFTANINDNEINNGKFFSSASPVEQWRAERNSAAALPDTTPVTQLKPGESKLNFSFKDVTGKTVSINDARFKNKVVIIQIMGSWCPNCMDESKFLSSFYKEYKNKGVEIIALAYEYSIDFNRSKASVQKFIKRFGIQYPVLIPPVTVSDEQRTEKTLPQLTAIRSFPTTIFISKSGNVAGIHQGFFGPGTGNHYEEFKAEFYRTIRSLLAD
ncbi:TlpA family protein disulfide reductase [Lacibacter luteus]|uniref:TlpA family protein disulfide reductase n=1 Tax=Lacibacter luteus TaxID=2508719 RepID=A0A4Q1CP86_9BACT|nr:TlpA family protein disulfide reductase [Lacibacter luteus]